MKPAAQPSRSVWLLLIGVVMLAAVVRFWGIRFGLPYTQARPDETHIIETARTILNGTLASPFYDYPWLYMWVATVLYLGYYVWGAAHGVFHSVAEMTASWPTNW